MLALVIVLHRMFRMYIIFPTSHISDTISVGKVKHYLSHFYDISFFRHLNFPTIFKNKLMYYKRPYKFKFELS